MEPDGLEKEQPLASLEKAPTLQVQNVVSTFSLGCKNLNLRQIASRLRFLEYNPHKVRTLKNPFLLKKNRC